MGVAPQEERARAHPPRESATYEGLNLNFIAGQWREGKSGDRRADESPWSGETLAEFTLADRSDVDEAYAAASAAWPRWWALLPHERAKVLNRALELMDRRKDEIISWIVRESGGTIAKANMEWMLARNITEEASTFPSRMAGEIFPASVPHKESRVYRDPVGVVTVISPFNFPWHLSMRSVAPALACGNAVMLKPASDTPITGGTLIGKLFEEAGVPPGLLNVVVGSGREIGDYIVEHPAPKVISFTGSTPVGQHLAELCGRHIKKVALELGGNAPMVILEDANLERAVEAAIFGSFSHQGQICMAINRLVVQRSIYDDFLERFVERAKALKVGDADDPETTIGPIINEKQRDGILERVKRTKEAGARAVLEGETRGLVIPPIVLADVANDMPAAKEENFGPVAPLIAFDDEEEGIAIANDTWAGLSAAIFTADLGRGAQLARRIEAGMVHVNDSPVNDEANTAFGGMKMSGLGRFGGKWAMDEFTQARWISVQEEPREYSVAGGP